MGTQWYHATGDIGAEVLSSRVPTRVSYGDGRTYELSCRVVMLAPTSSCPCSSGGGFR